MTKTSSAIMSYIKDVSNNCSYFSIEEEVLQTVATHQSDEIAKGRATIAQLGK